MPEQPTPPTPPVDRQQRLDAAVRQLSGERVAGNLALIRIARAKATPPPPQHTLGAALLDELARVRAARQRQEGKRR